MQPLIAILRGIRPDEIVAIAQVLIETGITQIEVPLNSPNAFASIELLVNHYADQAVIGAGTVLTTQQVVTLASLGAKMIISPNCNPDVIQQTKALGLMSFPGVFTATDCFNALAAGADGLKFFPAVQLGIEGYKAIKAVLPNNTLTYAVGGIASDQFPTWLAAGIHGFGIGSALYKPQDTAQSVRQKAQQLIQGMMLPP